MIVKSTDNHGLYQIPVKPYFAGGFTQLKDNVIGKNGFVRYWDKESKAPYLFNEAQKAFITYDDEESVADKYKYVKKQHLAGVMFWEYFSDPKGYLLDVINKEL